MSASKAVANCMVCGKPETAWTVNYKQAGKLGFAHTDCLPSDLAVALVDSAFVYGVLKTRLQRLPGVERDELAPKIHWIVAVAKYVGWEEALRWRREDLATIKEGLKRVRNRSELPKGWPFGEFWLLGESDGELRVRDVGSLSQEQLPGGQAILIPAAEDCATPGLSEASAFEDVSYIRHKILYQRSIWVDPEGHVHHLNAISTEHLVETADYLEIHTAELHLAERMLVALEKAEGTPVAGWTAPKFEEPFDWLCSTPLFQAFAVEIEDRRS